LQGKCEMENDKVVNDVKIKHTRQEEGKLEASESEDILDTSTGKFNWKETTDNDDTKQVNVKECDDTSLVGQTPPSIIETENDSDFENSTVEQVKQEGNSDTMDIALVPWYKLILPLSKESHTKHIKNANKKRTYP